VRRLEAEYIATAKNGIVARVYDRLGLQRVADYSSSTRYALDRIDSAKCPSWISMNNHKNEQ
jgi:hypothetical protein